VEQLEEARAMAGLPKEDARRRLTVGFRGRSRVNPPPEQV
jgi:hypothetical protein